MCDDSLKFLSMTKEQQISMIEDIIMDMMDEGLVEIVGFDEENNPYFNFKGVK